MEFETEIRNCENNLKIKVLVLGLAKSGESAARLLDRLERCDRQWWQTFEENPAAQSLLEEGIKVVTGGHPLNCWMKTLQYGQNPGSLHESDGRKSACIRAFQSSLKWELAYLISDAPIVGLQDQTEKRRRNHDRGKSWRLLVKVVYCLGISVPASQSHKHDRKDVLPWNCLLSNWWELKPSIQNCSDYQPHANPYRLPWFFFENYVAANGNLQKNMTEKMSLS